MNIFSQIIFYVILTLVFLTEGLGIPYGREMSYYLILAMPFFLFALDTIQKKRIHLPVKVFQIILVLLIFDLVSTLFSIDIQRSFKNILYLISIFIMFLYAYNHRKELKKSILYFVFFLSTIFMLYSIFLYRFLPRELNFLIPTRGYQFVFAFYNTHHPISNLIILLTMMGLFATLFMNIKYIIPTVIFLILLFFTYSRSSYLVIAEIAIIMLGYKYIVKKTSLYVSHLFIVAAICISSIVFFLSATNFNTKMPVISEIKQILHTNLGLPDKSPLSMRNIYFSDAIRAIKNRPLFGLGPDNYIFASMKYGATHQVYSETSDNIILEIFSETGIFAGITFIILLLFLFFGKKHILDPVSKMIFFTALGMFLLFQTDSSQLFYSYFLLFFILLGIQYQTNKHYSVRPLYILILPIFLLLLTFVRFTSLSQL